MLAGWWVTKGLGSQYWVMGGILPTEQVLCLADTAGTTPGYFVLLHVPTKDASINK